jgi:hypothetical protein
MPVPRTVELPLAGTGPSGYPPPGRVSAFPHFLDSIATEGDPMKKWLLVPVLFSLIGCAANPEIADLKNGTFCSSENVEAYAKKNNMTYEQSLAALRKKSDAMWAEEEARHASQTKPKATIVPETAKKTSLP